MPDYSEDWHPGSFTKNFGWGKDGRGLAELHQAIRIGFGEAKNDIKRADFRQRLEARGVNFYIPANFFLFNYSNNLVIGFPLTSSFSRRCSSITLPTLTGSPSLRSTFHWLVLGKEPGTFNGGLPYGRTDTLLRG